MSSGSQIGGAVGAVVGGVIGFYTGNVAQGVQWGYAIGSAVGGYVDPTRSYGPRLEDANAQTSTVGGVIPFGYGTFTCMGNIIWCDDLIEHVKTERVGKGGGEKQTTYTYTRSYAIGVCEGPISRYMWIKKNGKLVYAADPAALGAAMGWDGEQIADLSASSNEFRQVTTLYYGTADQMPDPVIEAVEGVGNVAPHRDLAYIVMENEDLTDMQGAVSQYEFCVDAHMPDVYVTSKPYSLLVQESVQISSVLRAGNLRQLLFETGNDEAVHISASVITGELRDQYIVRRYQEASEVKVSLTGGQLKSVRVETGFNEAVNILAIPSGGRMTNPLITMNPLREANGISATPTGGQLV